MGADAIRAAGQTDPSGREDAGSFTKEHQGTLHFFTIYQCNFLSGFFLLKCKENIGEGGGGKFRLSKNQI